MRLRVIVTILVLLIGAATGLTARQASPAQLAFEAARMKEVVDHDLSAAIVQYRAVVAKYASDRVVVPEALLRLAGCQEQLGQPDARVTYERVVKDYPDTGPAKAAQMKLAVFGKERSGLTITQLDGDAFGAPSMDGRYLSFTDEETGDLAVRDLRSGGARRVTGSGSLSVGHSASLSVPSPNGHQIAYISEDSGRVELRVISSRGGETRVLCCSDRRLIPRPFGWSMDGKQVLFATKNYAGAVTTQLMSVSVSGGAPRVLKTVEGAVRRACWSPDGRFIIYDAQRVLGTPVFSLFIMRSDGSNSAVLIPHAFNDQMLDWFPDGKRILFLSDLNGPRSVFTQRIIDGKALGGAVLVSEIKHDMYSSRIEGLGFTRDGSYHYLIRTTRQDVLTFQLDASGAGSPEVARLAGGFAGGRLEAVWSPDGSQIAWRQLPIGVPQPSLLIQAVTGGRVHGVPIQLARLANPAWTPDGLAIIAEGTTKQGGQGLFRINLENGAHSPVGEITTATTGRRSHPVVSMDGREVLYVLDSKSVQARDLISGTVRVVFEGPVRSLALSPDGRFVAVALEGRHIQGQTYPVQIIPAAGGPARGLAAETETGGLGVGLAWSPDGRFLWFNHDSATPGMPLWCVPVDGGPARRVNALSKGLLIERLSTSPNGTMAVSVWMTGTEQFVMRNIPADKPAAKR